MSTFPEQGRIEFEVMKKDRGSSEILSTRTLHPTAQRVVHILNTPFLPARSHYSLLHISCRFRFDLRMRNENLLERRFGGGNWERGDRPAGCRFTMGGFCSDYYVGFSSVSFEILAGCEERALYR